MKLDIFFFSLIRKFTEASILRTHFIYAVLSYIKIMIIFNNTSADFVLISADVHIIENYHDFDRTLVY